LPSQPYDDSGHAFNAPPFLSFSSLLREFLATADPG